MKLKQNIFEKCSFKTVLFQFHVVAQTVLGTALCCLILRGEKSWNKQTRHICVEQQKNQQFCFIGLRKLLSYRLKIYHVLFRPFHQCCLVIRPSIRTWKTAFHPEIVYRRKEAFVNSGLTYYFEYTSLVLALHVYRQRLWTKFARWLLIDIGIRLFADEVSSYFNDCLCSVIVIIVVVFNYVV